jgi:hypothetical protein
MMIEIGQIFDRENTYTWKKAMMNAYLLSSSLCVCNDDHLSRDRRRVLSILSPSFLMRVSVVRPHQTLFFSRIVINSFTEGERESQGSEQNVYRSRSL